jgi:hypothetical protein
MAQRRASPGAGAHVAQLEEGHHEAELVVAQQPQQQARFHLLAAGGGVIECPPPSARACSKIYTVMAVKPVIEHVPMEAGT